MRAEYGVGVGTLREILSRLAAEGLVLAEGQRGFEVPPVTARNLRELAELRLMLEQHALRRSFAAGDVEWEGRVVAAHHKLDVVERRMLDGARETDLEALRRRVPPGADLRLRLARADGGARQRLRPLPALPDGRLFLPGQRGGARASALRDCALARDADGAIAVLTGHIDDCVAFTLKSDCLSG